MKLILLLNEETSNCIVAYNRQYSEQLCVLRYIIEYVHDI